MNTPLFSVSECTTFPGTFAADVAAYREGGADGIGIWEFKLEPGKDDDHIATLRDSGLRASICVPDVPSVYPDLYFASPADPSARVPLLCDAIQRLARFEPEAVLVVTGAPIADMTEMRRTTVAGLKRAAAVAADVGVKIVIEPYRATSGAMVNTLGDGVALANDVDAPNVGVVVDLWHLWDQPGIEDELRRFGDRIFGVQVSDWRRPTRSWADRVLPGDGIIDLPTILRAVEDGGYDGWYDLEIFSDDGRFGERYADSIALQDPVAVTRRAREGFLAAWEARLASAF